MKRVNNTTNTILTMPININELLFKTIVYILCTVIIPRSKFYKIAR